MLCSNYSSLWSQSRLPMKNLTVGNKFVYLASPKTGGQFLFYEQVVRDTSISGKRYGIIFNSYDNTTQIERSDDSTIFVYDVLAKTESIYHCLKGGCVFPAWYFFEGAVRLNLYSNQNDSLTRVSTFQANYPVFISTFIVQYTKPLGISEIQYHSRYTYTPNPSPFNRNPQPITSEISKSAILRGALIQNQVIGDTSTRAVFDIKLINSQKLTYGRVVEIPIRLQVFPSYGNLRPIQHLYCRIDVDTTLVEIASLSPIYANRPDSVKSKNGVLSLYCNFNFSSSDPILDIGSLGLRSKILNDSTTTISITEISTIPQYSVRSTSITVSIAPRTIGVGLKLQSNSLGFGKTFLAPLVLQDYENNSALGVIKDKLLNIRSFQFTITVDSSQLGMPTVFSSVTTNTILLPIATRLLTNGMIQLEYEILTESISDGVIGYLSLRSKASVNQQSVIQCNLLGSAIGNKFIQTSEAIVTVARTMWLDLSNQTLPYGKSTLPILLRNEQGYINEQLFKFNSINVTIGVDSAKIYPTSLVIYDREGKEIPSKTIEYDKWGALVKFTLPVSSESVKNGLIGTMNLQTRPLSNTLTTISSGFEEILGYSCWCPRYNTNTIQVVQQGAISVPSDIIEKVESGQNTIQYNILLPILLLIKLLSDILFPSLRLCKFLYMIL